MKQEKIIKPITYQHLDYRETVAGLHKLLQAGNFSDALDEFHKISDNLPDLKLVTNNYARHILSTDNGYWLSVLNWDDGAESPIHGHPDFSFVYVISGEIQSTGYQESPLQKTKKNVYKAGDYFYSRGEKGRFNNAIHQLFATKNTQTLHFYSDNPEKGYSF